MGETHHWVDCHDCGLRQSLPDPVAGHGRHCYRCHASFGRGVLRTENALALVATALTLFLLATLFPLLAIEVSGHTRSIHLGSMVTGLIDHDLFPLALFVLLIALLAPFGQIAALGYVLLHLRNGSRFRHAVFFLRLAAAMRPWAMFDVFLIGALVTLTKLHDLASIEIDVGFWAIGLLVLVLALLDLAIDPHALWDLVSPPPRSADPPPASSLSCANCALVQPPASHCARCRARLHRRRPESLTRAAALVVTGFVLYLPANLFPVITVISFGRGTSATIIGGVLELLNGSDWPLAVIVFTASVAVPLLKLVGLGWLLVSTRIGRRARLTDRTRLYRLIELVSRWSAVDIFVSALLTALVTLGNLATIEPGLGVLAFGAVVFVTMLATEHFDPRLMWDFAGANHAP